MSENTQQYFLICSIQHRAWWGPGRWGYTKDLCEAGLYTRSEAKAIVDEPNILRPSEFMIPVTAIVRAEALQG